MSDAFTVFAWPKQNRCERCGDAWCIGLAWGVRLCSSCWSDWCADKSMGTAAINAALGLPNAPELYVAANFTLYASEARRRTVEWAQKGKAA